MPKILVACLPAGTGVQNFEYFSWVTRKKCGPLCVWVPRGEARRRNSENKPFCLCWRGRKGRAVIILCVRARVQITVPSAKIAEVRESYVSHTRRF